MFVCIYQLFQCLKTYETAHISMKQIMDYVTISLTEIKYCSYRYETQYDKAL